MCLILGQILLDGPIKTIQSDRPGGEQTRRASSSRDFLCRIWYPFEVRAEIEVRLIHTFQPQEMHSAKGISGNDRPIIMRHGACCHVRIHG